MRDAVPGSVARKRERGGFVIALAALAVTFVFGVTVARRYDGPGLVWDVMSYEQALTALRQQLSGAGCEALIQQAAVRIEGQVARFSIGQLGTVIVQSHYLGFVTVRPESPLVERDDCRFAPARPERLISGNGPSVGTA